MDTFTEIFAPKKPAYTYAASRMPKIIAIGLAATVAIALIGKPIDGFIEWRAGAAEERKIEEAVKEREAAAEAAKVEQGAREARERAQLLERNRAVISDRVQRTEAQRQTVLQGYQEIFALAAEEGAQGEAAREALEKLPVPEALTVQKMLFAADSDDDILSGRSPNADAAVSNFHSETQQAHTYVNQLKRLYNQLAQEKQRAQRTAEIEAQREAQRIAREEAQQAAQESREASRAQSATRQQAQPQQRPQQQQQPRQTQPRNAVSDW